jgi:glucose-6-phosphate dehydrogenase assembly protein OpcA
VAVALMDQKIKGHLFNLIIFTREQRRADYFRQMVHSLVEKFPSRVIYIHADAESEDRQYLKETDETCEQITLSASHSLTEQIPFLLLPHLIPDLPVFLVWGDDPSVDNAILPSIEKLATRLIFDAECAEDLQAFIKKMLVKIETLNIEFMDISWAEISGWRDVISQVFNSRSQLAYLNRCNSIQIQYNQLDDPYIEHDSVQAIYLQGWLAAQLGWEFQSLSEDNGQHTINYKNQKVILTPQSRPQLPPGQIFEISFQDQHLLNTTLTFAEKQSKVMAYISTPDDCQVPYSLQLLAAKKGVSAMNEMFYFRPSKHYRQMLKSIANIHWNRF